jgi:hypothetical protein
MLLQSVQHNVQCVNTGEETELSVVLDAVAFDILGSKQYSDVRSSIVRELSCNAMDSHVQAGYPDRPFVIHLPSAMEPYLSIKDTGVGLDDDGVRKTLLTYCKSSKRQSSNAVGAFGLGSKTPFAYTNAFTITAVKDGIARTYSAYIKESGIPAVTRMGGDMETDQPNGVEIMVPVVNEDDFDLFAQAVSQQLCFFKVKPRITNGLVSFAKYDARHASGGLYLLNDHGNDELQQSVYIVQGGVGYPLNVYSVKSHLTGDNPAFLDFLTANGAILEFPIGSIEVTTSRESVSYTKFTLANIDAMLTETLSTVAVSMFETFSEVKTEWERALFLNSNTSYAKMMLRAGCDVASLMPSLAGELHYHNTASSWGIKTEDFVTKMPSFRVTEWAAQWKRKQYKTGIKESNVQSVKADKAIRFVIHDTEDKCIVRMRNFLEASAGVPTYELTGDNPAVIVALLANIGVPSEKIVMLSSLPVPPRKVSTSRYASAAATTAYLREARDKRYDAKDWSKVTTKWKELKTLGGIYVVIPEGCRFNIRSLENSHEFIFDMHEEGCLDKEFYAIRERDLHRIKDNPEWIHAKDAAIAYLADYAASDRLFYGVAGRQALGEAETSLRLAVSHLTSFMERNEIPVPEVISEYQHRFEVVSHKARANTEDFEESLLRYNFTDKYNRIHSRLSRYLKGNENTVLAHFPLLDHMPSFSRFGRDDNHPALADFADYVTRSR